MHYHALSIPQVLKKLQTSEAGLSDKDVEKRRRKFGRNQLSNAGEKTGRLRIFLNQWKSPLIIILIIAGLTSGMLGETLDMVIILITAGINGLIGFFQEDKANQALSRLRSMVEYKAAVIRHGIRKEIASDDIVPGDILRLSAGNKVQADGRILSAKDFTVNEAALTGESVPVKKHARTLKPGTAVSDCTNMVFRGTVVTNGEATVAVTATGDATELGHIAKMVRETDDEDTPLQKQLARLSKMIGAVILAIASAIVALGFFTAGDSYHIIDLFETAVAVAVAAIPEGLAITLTVILAIGMQHMVKRRALVRRLVAAETLGSVSVICTDKTGTLTEGEMQLVRILTRTHEWSQHDIEMNTAGHASEDILVALKIAALANDASVERSEDDPNRWIALGESTDAALARAAAQCGLPKETLDKSTPRKDSIPFSSEYKYMATLHALDGHALIYAKGAPDVLFSRVSAYFDGERVRALGEKDRDWFSKRLEDMTSNGLRVLALAYKETAPDKKIRHSDLADMVLVGLVALADPLRKEVPETLAAAKRAGIHVAMITGDYAETARFIAEQIGLDHARENILNGADIERMNESELQTAVERCTIFARVNPAHKIRIVRAFQANGDVVAMTGDGVNDAPALKGADIGVALGSGTDVAKETSDMVLLDDSFSTIVAAVEEGRRMYQNIKKVILYLMAGSFTEVMLIAGSLIGNLPLPLLPAQILWTNIVQEAFPTIALAFDRGDRENMTDPPRRRQEPIFDQEMKVLIFLITAISNTVLFLLFLYFLRATGDIQRVRTLMFVGVGINALIYIFSIRSLRHYVWQMNPFSNSHLNWALALSWLLLLAAVYVPGLQTLLRTTPLSIREWGIMIAFGGLGICIIESCKSFYLVKARIH